MEQGIQIQEFVLNPAGTRKWLNWTLYEQLEPKSGR